LDSNLNQSNNQPQNEGVQIANLANIITLIGSFIVVAAKEDSPILAAALIKYLAGFMFLKAGLLEAENQQIAPGVTTFANRLKIGGSIISIIGASLLTWALLIEIAVKQRSGATGITQPVVPPFTAGTGAFTV
jgi:hypothetical protein